MIAIQVLCRAGVVFPRLTCATSEGNRVFRKETCAAGALGAILDVFRAYSLHLISRRLAVYWTRLARGISLPAHILVRTRGTKVAGNDTGLGASF